VQRSSLRRPAVAARRERTYPPPTAARSTDPEIYAALTAAGVAPTVVSAFDVTPAHVEAHDLVIAAGGDGTVLRAAAAVRQGSRTPLIGVNTDPLFSTGALCAAAVEAPAQPALPRARRAGAAPGAVAGAAAAGAGSFAECLERLRAGAFSWRLRRRLRLEVGREERRVAHQELTFLLFSTRRMVRTTTLSPSAVARRIMRSLIFSHLLSSSSSPRRVVREWCIECSNGASRRVTATARRGGRLASPLRDDQNGPSWSRSASSSPLSN